jgi:phage FluMu protein Com
MKKVNSRRSKEEKKEKIDKSNRKEW